MSDKTLLITGASADIGIELIKTVIDSYSIIYAHFGHSGDKISALAEKYNNKIIPIEEDLNIPNAGVRIVESINSRGIWPDHYVHLPCPRVENVRFTKADIGVYDKYMNVCFKSAVTVSGLLIDNLVKNKKEGRIVFMLSSYTDGIPPRFLTPYVSAKYALLGLMKSLATEYDSKGITVNGVSPGMIDTGFLTNISEHVIEANAEKSPFGRNLSVNEVVPTIAFLLSEEASKITGQNLVITGGLWGVK